MTGLVYAMGTSPAGAGAQPAGQAAGGGMMSTFLMLIIIFAIFYFLLLRPQQKEQKKHEEMLKNLAKGDKVITTGGLHGVIVGISERDGIVVLRIADDVKVEVSRSAIASLKAPASASPEAKQ